MSQSPPITHVRPASPSHKVVSVAENAEKEDSKSGESASALTENDKKPLLRYEEGVSENTDVRQTKFFIADELVSRARRKYYAALDRHTRRRGYQSMDSPDETQHSERGDAKSSGVVATKRSKQTSMGTDYSMPVGNTPSFSGNMTGERFGTSATQRTPLLPKTAQTNNLNPNVKEAWPPNSIMSRPTSNIVPGARLTYGTDGSSVLFNDKHIQNKPVSSQKGRTNHGTSYIENSRDPDTTDSHEQTDDEDDDNGDEDDDDSSKDEDAEDDSQGSPDDASLVADTPPKVKSNDVFTSALMDRFKLKKTEIIMSARKILAKIDMASLQSPRTQCCCCAVGVFAAMFGIFMLSAGICIVLNVTFMEVDTSGLPPELHNDNGKKVVGIILICVAIAFLGLSATVSVLYFTLCSRKERPTASSASAANQNQQQQQLHGARAKHSQNGGRRGLDRPNSKDSVKSGSQASLRSGRSIASPSAIDGVQFSKSVASAVPGRLQNQSSRNHTHAGAYSRAHGHPKKKGIRPGRYRGPGLEPHLEEDVEMAKSGDRSRPTSAKDAGTGEGAASASASSRVPPAIVIDEHSQEPFTPMSTMSSCDDYMETQFTENGLPYDRDDSVLTNTFDDEQSLQGVMGAEGGSYPSHYNDTSFPDSDGYAAEYNKQDFTSHQPVTYGTDSLEGSLSSSSSNNNVLNDKPSRNHSSSPPPTISNTQLHHNILKVKPSKDAEINTPGSSSNTLDSLDQYEMNVEESDHQPSSSNTNSQDVNRQISSTTEGDSQGSQGSFNPAFSYDGEDPETVDTQKRSNKFIDERL